MIGGLDFVLGQTLVTAIPSIVTRLGFQPPDDAWRQRVSQGTGLWLNCALVDLREDRHRRSTEVRFDPVTQQRRRAPFLLRCHYLISAWNSAKDSQSVPASVQEHALIGQVVTTLVDASSLTPAAVLLPAELATLPTDWQEASFDIDLLPPEGFPKLAEFWGTMGRGAPWRPSVWLVVTVPVALEPSRIDGIVTTLVAGLGQDVPTAEPLESLDGLGGVVLDASGSHAGAPVPVASALVTLTDAAGNLRGRAVCQDDGRFVLTGVPPGSYLVSARAAAHAPLPPAPLTVPPPGPGPLKLQFT
ncbi:Pvc16 family protein [Streptomyces sp. NPDC006446]|uniref:Pvc16 family protein n=1 Tax=Streptomyces sp. NPDC006446 TaxID=3154301 RepID=UPI0033A73BB9